MHHIILASLSLLSLTSCSDKDEQWCDQLLLDACACEAGEESDLCQDAEVVANSGDEESCEQYYFEAVPTSCHSYPDNWSGGSGGKNACEELAECLGADADGAANATDEAIVACEGLLDEYDC
jgi:hypothetical protein